MISRICFEINQGKVRREKTRLERLYANKLDNPEEMDINFWKYATYQDWIIKK